MINEVSCPRDFVEFSLSGKCILVFVDVENEVFETVEINNDLVILISLGLNRENQERAAQ